MMKRLVDILFAGGMLLVFAPVLLIAALVIWCDDHENPFHLSPRVGQDKRPFNMYKLRTMRHSTRAHSCYVTTAQDERITRIGKFMRRYKLDELPQLFNVLKGDMSIVGPRPRMQSEIADYGPIEQGIFSVRPGTTDIATILFSIEERKLLKNVEDPNLIYNTILRPWKSRLNLFYIAHQSLWLDIEIIALTALVVVRRRVALRLLARMMQSMGAPRDVVAVMRRKRDIRPIPLPDDPEALVERSVA